MPRMGGADFPWSATQPFTRFIRAKMKTCRLFRLSNLSVLIIRFNLLTYPGSLTSVCSVSDDMVGTRSGLELVRHLLWGCDRQVGQAGSPGTAGRAR